MSYKHGLADLWDCLAPWFIVFGLMVLYSMGGLVGAWCVVAASEFIPWTYPAYVQEDYYRIHPGPYIFPRKYPSLSGTTNDTH